MTEIRLHWPMAVRNSSACTRAICRGAWRAGGTGSDFGIIQRCTHAQIILYIWTMPANVQCTDWSGLSRIIKYQKGGWAPSGPTAIMHSTPGRERSLALKGKLPWKRRLWMETWMQALRTASDIANERNPGSQGRQMMMMKYQTLDIEFSVIWLALYSRYKSFIL